MTTILDFLTRREPHLHGNPEAQAPDPGITVLLPR